MASKLGCAVKSVTFWREIMMLETSCSLQCGGSSGFLRRRLVWGGWGRGSQIHQGHDFVHKRVVRSLIVVFFCQSAVLTAKSSMPLYIMSSKPCAHVGFPLDQSPSPVHSVSPQPSLPFPSEKHNLWSKTGKKYSAITWAMTELETSYFVKLIITEAQSPAVPSVRDSTIIDFMSLVVAPGATDARWGPGWWKLR